jgi:anti-sigma28 factor (negative regulator of flagellin synthesis)
MRIHRASKNMGMEEGAKTRRAAPSAPSVSIGTDRVQLSALSQMAAGFGAERLDKVQAAVNAGTYEVAAAEVSRHIVDFYLIPIN